MGDEEDLYEALIRADRSGSLGPLAEGMGRELNEALAKVLAGLSLARAIAPSEPLESAEFAAMAARDIARRIGGLGQPGGKGAWTAIAAEPLLAEAIASAAAGGAAEVLLSVAGATGEVRGDRALLLQVFQNLVRNAAEAMTPAPPRPRIQVTAANALLEQGQIADLPAGEYVEFEVRDNGVGISPAHLEKIWDPFFTTRKHATGLGLATVLSTVRRHGGQIGVDSELGIGTVFTVFLPRARPSAQGGGLAPGASRFRTGRVLVMDDDDAMRSLITGLLEKLDYKSDAVRDGEEAIAAYRRYRDIGRPHDVVILDLVTPGKMAGEEALVQLKELDPDVRTIGCGNESPESLRARCEAAGFSGWLAKPYRLQELAEVLRSVAS